MRVAVIAYNFPHKKTQDFLCRLFLDQVDVALVLAADAVKLNIPPATVRMKVRQGGGLVHPRSIAARFGWNYQVADHNSPEAIELLKEAQVDVAVISGARILKAPVVDAVPGGIVNFHPGILPEGRGLDAMQWALYENRPLGVTAHLIDSRVDAGVILLKQEIAIQSDDTVYDLSQRLADIQIDMLPQVLNAIESGDYSGELVGKGNLHRKMPPELEREIPEILRKRQGRTEESSNP